MPDPYFIPVRLREGASLAPEFEGSTDVGLGRNLPPLPDQVQEPSVQIPQPRVPGVDNETRLSPVLQQDPSQRTPEQTRRAVRRIDLQQQMNEAQQLDDHFLVQMGLELERVNESLFPQQQGALTVTAADALGKVGFKDWAKSLRDIGRAGIQRGAEAGQEITDLTTDQRLGTQFAGAVVGSGFNSAPAMLAAPLGLAAMAGAAGLQSYSSTFADAVTELQSKDPTKSLDQLEAEAYPTAILSGLITASITALGGKTGIESVLANKAVPAGFAAFVKNLAKQMGAEALEEGTDEAWQSVLQSLTFRPETTAGDALKQIFMAAGAGGLISGVVNVTQSAGQAAGLPQSRSQPKQNPNAAKITPEIAKWIQEQADQTIDISQAVDLGSADTFVVDDILIDLEDGRSKAIPRPTVSGRKRNTQDAQFLAEQLVSRGFSPAVAAEVSSIYGGRQSGQEDADFINTAANDLSELGFDTQGGEAQEAANTAALNDLRDLQGRYGFEAFRQAFPDVADEVQPGDIDTQPESALEQLENAADQIANSNDALIVAGTRRRGVARQELPDRQRKQLLTGAAQRRSGPIPQRPVSSTASRTQRTDSVQEALDPTVVATEEAVAPDTQEQPQEQKPVKNRLRDRGKTKTPKKPKGKGKKAAAPKPEPTPQEEPQAPQEERPVVQPPVRKFPKKLTEVLGVTQPAMPAETWQSGRTFDFIDGDQIRRGVVEGGGGNLGSVRFVDPSTGRLGEYEGLPMHAKSVLWNNRVPVTKQDWVAGKPSAKAVKKIVNAVVQVSEKSENVSAKLDQDAVERQIQKELGEVLVEEEDGDPGLPESRVQTPATDQSARKPSTTKPKSRLAASRTGKAKGKGKAKAKAAPTPEPSAEPEVGTEVETEAEVEPTPPAAPLPQAVRQPTTTNTPVETKSTVLTIAQMRGEKAPKHRAYVKKDLPKKLQNITAETLKQLVDLSVALRNAMTAINGFSTGEATDVNKQRIANLQVTVREITAARAELVEGWAPNDFDAAIKELDSRATEFVKAQIRGDVLSKTVVIRDGRVQNVWEEDGDRAQIADGGNESTEPSVGPGNAVHVQAQSAPIKFGATRLPKGVKVDLSPVRNKGVKPSRKGLRLFRLVLSVEGSKTRTINVSYSPKSKQWFYEHGGQLRGGFDIRADMVVDAVKRVFSVVEESSEVTPERQADDSNAKAAGFQSISVGGSISVGRINKMLTGKVSDSEQDPNAPEVTEKLKVTKKDPPPPKLPEGVSVEMMDVTTSRLGEKELKSVKSKFFQLRVMLSNDRSFLIDATWSAINKQWFYNFNFVTHGGFDSPITMAVDAAKRADRHALMMLPPIEERRVPPPPRKMQTPPTPTSQSLVDKGYSGGRILPGPLPADAESLLLKEANKMSDIRMLQRDPSQKQAARSERTALTKMRKEHNDAFERLGIDLDLISRIRKGDIEQAIGESRALRGSDSQLRPSVDSLDSLPDPNRVKGNSGQWVQISDVQMALDAGVHPAEAQATAQRPDLMKLIRQGYILWGGEFRLPSLSMITDMDRAVADQRLLADRQMDLILSLVRRGLFAKSRKSNVYWSPSRRKLVFSEPGSEGRTLEAEEGGRLTKVTPLELLRILDSKNPSELDMRADDAETGDAAEEGAISPERIAALNKALVEAQVTPSGRNTIADARDSILFESDVARVLNFTSEGLSHRVKASDRGPGYTRQSRMRSGSITSNFMMVDLTSSAETAAQQMSVSDLVAMIASQVKILENRVESMRRQFARTDTGRAYRSIYGTAELGHNMEAYEFLARKLLLGLRLNQQEARIVSSAKKVKADQWERATQRAENMIKGGVDPALFKLTEQLPFEAATAYITRLRGMAKAAGITLNNRTDPASIAQAIRESSDTIAKNQDLIEAFEQAIRDYEAKKAPHSVPYLDETQKQMLEMMVRRSGVDYFAPHQVEALFNLPEMAPARSDEKVKQMLLVSDLGEVNSKLPGGIIPDQGIRKDKKDWSTNNAAFVYGERPQAVSRVTQAFLDKMTDHGIMVESRGPSGEVRYGFTPAGQNVSRLMVEGRIKPETLYTPEGKPSNVSRPGYAKLESDPMGRHLRSGGKTQNMTVASVRLALGQAISQNGRVNIVQSVSEAPAALQAEIQEASGGKPELASGWFDTSTGTIYLFADNIGSPEHAVATLRHELIGHYGLEESLGEGAGEFFDTVFSSYEGSPEMAAVVKRYGLDPENPLHRRLIAKELVAMKAESGKLEVEWWRRLVASIRSWLREAGFIGTVSDNDIRAAIADSARVTKAASLASADKAAGEFSDLIILDQPASNGATVVVPPVRQGSYTGAKAGSSINIPLVNSAQSVVGGRLHSSDPSVAVTLSYRVGNGRLRVAVNDKSTIPATQDYANAVLAEITATGATNEDVVAAAQEASMEAAKASVKRKDSKSVRDAHASISDISDVQSLAKYSPPAWRADFFNSLLSKFSGTPSPNAIVDALVDPDLASSPAGTVIAEADGIGGGSWAVDETTGQAYMKTDGGRVLNGDERYSMESQESEATAPDSDVVEATQAEPAPAPPPEPTTIRTPKTLREFLETNRDEINETQYRIWTALLNSKALGDLDLARIQVVFDDLMSGNEMGSMQTKAGRILVKLSRRAAPGTLPHEIFHAFYDLLKSEDKAIIDRTRLQEIDRQLSRSDLTENQQAFLGRLKREAMTSQGYVDYLNDNDIRESEILQFYHLINPDETFAGYGGKQFAEDSVRPENRGVLSRLWESFKSFFKAIGSVVEPDSDNPDGIDRIYKRIIAGEYANNPHMGAMSEAKTGDRQSRGPVEESSSGTPVPTVEGEVSKYLAKAASRRSRSVLDIATDKITMQVGALFDFLTRHGDAVGASQAAMSDLGITDYTRLVAATGQSAKDWRKERNGYIGRESFQSVASAVGIRLAEFLGRSQQIRNDHRSIRNRMLSGAYFDEVNKLTEETIEQEALGVTAQTLQGSVSDAIDKTTRELQRVTDSDIRRAAIEKRLTKLRGISGQSAMHKALLKDIIKTFATDDQSTTDFLDNVRDVAKLQQIYAQLKQQSPDQAAQYDPDVVALAIRELTKSPKIAEDLVLSQNVNESIVAAMDSEERRIRDAFLKDPTATVRATLSAAASLGGRQARITRRVLLRNKKLKADIEKMSALQEAVNVLDSIENDPEWIRYQNQVFNDSGMRVGQSRAVDTTYSSRRTVTTIPKGNSPDAPDRVSTSSNHFSGLQPDQFVQDEKGNVISMHANPIIRYPSDSGLTDQQIFLSTDSENYTRDQTVIQEAIDLWTTWKMEQDQLHSLDRDIHYEEWVDYLKYLDTMLNSGFVRMPNSIQQRHIPVLGDVRLMNTFIDKIGVRAGKLVKQSVAVWDSVSSKASIWLTKNINQHAGLAVDAFRSHGFDETMSNNDAANKWYREIGRPLFAAAQIEGGEIRAGMVVGNGHVVTQSDMNLLKFESERASEGFEIVQDIMPNERDGAAFTPRIRQDFTVKSSSPHIDHVKIEVYGKSIKTTKFTLPMSGWNTRAMELVTGIYRAIGNSGSKVSADENDQKTNVIERFLSEDELNSAEIEASLETEFPLFLSFISDRSNVIVDGASPLEEAYRSVANEIKTYPVNDSANKNLDYLSSRVGEVAGIPQHEARAIMLREMGRVLDRFGSDLGLNSNEVTNDSVSRAHIRNSFTTRRNEHALPYHFSNYGWSSSIDMIGFSRQMQTHALDRVLAGLSAAESEIEKETSELRKRYETELQRRGLDIDESSSKIDKGIRDLNRRDLQIGRTMLKLEETQATLQGIKRLVKDLHQIYGREGDNYEKSAKTLRILMGTGVSAIIAQPITTLRNAFNIAMPGLVLGTMSKGIIRIAPRVLNHVVFEGGAKHLASLTYGVIKALPMLAVSAVTSIGKPVGPGDSKNPIARWLMNTVEPWVNETNEGIYRRINRWNALNERGLVPVTDLMNEMKAKTQFLATNGLIVPEGFAEIGSNLASKTLIMGATAVDAWILTPFLNGLFPRLGDSTINVAIMSLSESIVGNMENNLERVFGILEKNGLLDERFDFENPRSPKNRITPAELFPGMFLESDVKKVTAGKKKQSLDKHNRLTHVEDAFEWAGVSVHDAAFRYIQKLREGGGSTEERMLTNHQMIAFGEKNINTINRGVGSNRPLWTKKNQGIYMWLAPLAGWPSAAAQSVWRGVSGRPVRGPEGVGSKPGEGSEEAIRFQMASMHGRMIAALMALGLVQDVPLEYMIRLFYKLTGKERGQKQFWEQDDAVTQGRHALAQSIDWIPGLNVLTSLGGTDVPSKSSMSPVPVAFGKIMDVAGSVREGVITGRWAEPTGRLVRGFLPVLNSVPGTRDEGSVRAANARNLLIRYGPTDKLKSFNGSGIFPISPYRPYAEDMLRSAMKGSPTGFAEAYQEGLRVALLAGEADPAEKIMSAYRGRDPFARAYARKLSDLEYFRVLQKASDDERSEIEKVAKIYKDSMTWLGKDWSPTLTDGPSVIQTGARQATAAPVSKGVANRLRSQGSRNRGATNRLQNRR